MTKMSVRTVTMPLLALASITAVNLTSIPAHAQAPVKDLNGIFHLSNEQCADEKTDTCFVYIEVRGAPAKAIYDSMRSDPQKDECGGGTMKIDDDALFCSQSDINGHVCFFGYDFVHKKIVSGDFAC